MEKIDYEVDDFMNYCDYKNLSKKSMKGYGQTLRLFIRYLKNECNITNTAQVYEQHKQFCDASEIERNSLSLSQFSNKMKEYGYKSTPTRMNKQSVRVYKKI